MSNNPTIYIFSYCSGESMTHSQISVCSFLTNRTQPNRQSRTLWARRRPIQRWENLGQIQGYALCSESGKIAPVDDVGTPRGQTSFKNVKLISRRMNFSSKSSELSVTRSEPRTSLNLDLEKFHATSYIIFRYSLFMPNLAKYFFPL